MTEHQAVLLSDPRTAGCVCVPLTFLHSAPACVCTSYRCGCVSTSICVCGSQFLPYYCLSAAFRLRFQLCCWATPSFSAPWSHFFHSRREWRRDQELCVLIWGHSFTIEVNVCELQARNWSQNTFQITFSPLSLSRPPAFLEAGFLLCTQSYAIKCLGRLPNTHPSSGLCSLVQTSSLQTGLRDYLSCTLLILTNAAWISKIIM